jgi:dihydrofolate reductase
VPFTLRNLKEDLEDVGSRFDGAPDLEFRLATEALELKQSGLSYQRVPYTNRWAADAPRAGGQFAGVSPGLRVLSPLANRNHLGRTPMPDTTCHMSISLDGFVAGPDQSREDPLGKRGRELHGWHLGDERANDADATATGWLMRPRGAYVMGRNMFGPIRGEWDEDWRGWWGPEPPYHAPVFVLTHHAHEPIEMEGGTAFHFVTDGFDAAYAQALETAGEGGVDIAGGASTVRQALIAGVVDELTLDVAPVLLGSGERIFDGVESFGLEPVEVLHSPLATHIRYRRAG